MQLFAYHYKTGEPLPMDYVRKLKEAAVFMEGLQTLRQLSFGFLDMAWHTADPAAISSVQAFERTATEKAELFPPIDALCISTAFSHISKEAMPQAITAIYGRRFYRQMPTRVLKRKGFSIYKPVNPSWMKFSPKAALKNR